MLLENLTYPEVETYLETENTILIPIGSVEQHSPYGLIGTDFITAEGIAREVGGKMDLLVAPTINYGVSPHHMAFKGTVTLSPKTLMNVVTDVALSLIEHGFRRIFIINGHGGNVSAIQTAMQEIKMKGTVGQFVLIKGYESVENKEIMHELFQGLDGSHATPSEVSLTQLLRPEAFDDRVIDHEEVETPKYYWPLTSGEMRKIFPDGRMGSAPWLASAEKGRVVMDLAVESVMKRISKAKSIPVME